MKTTTFPIFVFLIAAFLSTSSLQKLYSQCTVANPHIEVTNNSQVGNNCTTVYDFSFDIDANNGNSKVFLTIWTGEEPIIDFKKAPLAVDLTGNGVNPPKTTIAINNSYVISQPASALIEANGNIQQNVFFATYPPDPANGASINYQSYSDNPSLYLTKVNLGGTLWRYTVHNLLASWTTAGSDCSDIPAITGAFWGTQSEALIPSTHCIQDNLQTSVVQGNFITTFTCSTPQNGYSFNFSSITPSTFDWAVYMDLDGNKNWDPTLDRSLSGTGALPANLQSVTNATSFSPGILNYSYANKTEKEQDLFLVVYPDGYNETTEPTVYRILNNCLALPVAFGAIKAVNKSGQLIINWQALTEDNVKEYGVEVSNDGFATWKEIGRLPSKAINGNSTATLNYQLVVGVPISFAVVGFALTLLVPVFRSRKMQILTLLIVIGTVIIACTKSAREADVMKGEAAVFVRIAQYDNDNDKPQYSTVMKVINE